MRKKIWYISHYSAFPDEANPQKRQYFIGKYLANEYNVTLLFSEYDYFLKRKRDSGKNIFFSENFNALLLSNKISYRKNNWRRVANSITFGISVLLTGFRILITRGKPDFIISSVPSPFSAISALVLAKILRANYIVEIFDIWSITFVYLHGKQKTSLVVKVLIEIDKLLVKYADKIISPLDNFCAYSIDYLKINIKDKFVFVPQGFEDCDNNVNSGKSNFSEAAEWVSGKKQSGNKVVVFAGTMNSSNNIVALADSIRSILEITNDVTALFIGSGELKNELFEIFSAYLNKKVLISNSVPYNELCRIYSKCDFAMNSHQNIELYKYGISSLKSIDYIKANLPVAYLNRNDMVEKLGVGFSVESKSEYSRRLIKDVHDQKKIQEYKKNIEKAKTTLKWEHLVNKLREEISG